MIRICKLTAPYLCLAITLAMSAGGALAQEMIAFDGDKPVLVLYHREAASAQAKALSEIAQSLDSSGQVQFIDRAIPAIDSPERPAIVAISSELDAVGVRKIPAAVFVDEQGRAFAAIEAWPEPGEPLRTFVDQTLAVQGQRDAAFGRAASLDGQAKADAMHEGLQAVGELWWRGYLDEAQELVQLAQQIGDEAMVQRYMPKLVEIQIDRIVQDQVFPLIDLSRFGEAADRLLALETALPVTTEQTQTLRGFRAQLLVNDGRRDEARTLVQEAIKLSPDSDEAAKLRQILEQI